VKCEAFYVSSVFIAMYSVRGVHGNPQGVEMDHVPCISVLVHSTSMKVHVSIGYRS
jgi:hypothetical protein